MPRVTADDGTALFYTREGDGETVVFVSEAGLGGWSWGWQHAAVAGPFESIVWDLRGTGRSDAPPGPYSIATLAHDLEAVLAACGARRAHVVGAGLGGAVALHAASRSSRITTLTLVGTAATEGSYDLEPLFAPPEDLGAIRDSLTAGFSSAFLADAPAMVTDIVDWRADGDASRQGWAAQVAALDGFDAADWLVKVTQPTLVIHGLADELVPASAGRDLATGLPRGTFEGVEGAGHLAHIERSRPVNDRVVGFLEAHQRD